MTDLSGRSRVKPQAVSEVFITHAGHTNGATEVLRMIHVIGTSKAYDIMERVIPWLEEVRHNTHGDHGDEAIRVRLAHQDGLIRGCQRPQNIRES